MSCNNLLHLLLNAQNHFALMTRLARNTNHVAKKLRHLSAIRLGFFQYFCKLNHISPFIRTHEKTFAPWQTNPPRLLPRLTPPFNPHFKVLPFFARVFMKAFHLHWSLFASLKRISDLFFWGWVGNMKSTQLQCGRIYKDAAILCIAHRTIKRYCAFNVAASI